MTTKYVNTKIDNPNSVIGDLAENVGTGVAAGIVRKWYTEYNEFVYDTKIGDIVFFKKIHSGYWEVKQENVIQWK